MAANVVVDARKDNYLYTVSEIGADKTPSGEPVTVERVFPLPNVVDGCSPEEFGKAYVEFLEKMQALQGGASLTVIDEQGNVIWDKVTPDKENGLGDPFVGKPILPSTIVEYTKRSLGIDHNRVMRDVATEIAGIVPEKKSSGSRGKRISSLSKR